MTLYTNTDPFVVSAGRAKKQPSKLGENAQSPAKENFKKVNAQYLIVCYSSRRLYNLVRH